jgi:Family of unknown function (DUF6492)
MSGVGREPFTFVTVAFESELDLLLLQARSFATYVDADLVDCVLVIDNTARGMRPGFLERLTGEYGTFGDKMTTVRPADICAVPAAIGWRTQQVLKLEIARRVTSKRYVVLDAKNHFVAPPGRTFFQSADGRPRGTAYSYETHPMRSALEHTLAYMDLDPEPYVTRYTATVTPFVIDTAVARDLIAHIENESGRPFAVEFIDNDLSEFFLYTAWLLSRGQLIDDVSALDRISCATVWPRGATCDAMRAAVSTTVRTSAPVFSVHRTALAALDAEAAEVLIGFWTEAHLFASTEAARAFLDSARSQVIHAERRRKLREVRFRAATMIRRLGRR